MPINLPAGLPARRILEKEQIFALSEADALRQDIRPLEIGVLNLMPDKLSTEAQLARVLGNTPIQGLADRADVAEEVVRLRAHFAAFSERLRDGGVVGRTLDFLCQETLREINTLGSKSRSAPVRTAVVELKSLVERIREQVQNVE